MLSTSESFVSAEAAYRRDRVAAEVASLRRRPADRTTVANVATVATVATTSHPALALARLRAVLRARPAISG